MGLLYFTNDEVSKNLLIDMLTKQIALYNEYEKAQKNFVEHIDDLRKEYEAKQKQDRGKPKGLVLEFGPAKPINKGNENKNEGNENQNEGNENQNEGNEKQNEGNENDKGDNEVESNQNGGKK